MKKGESTLFEMDLNKKNKFQPYRPVSKENIDYNSFIRCPPEKPFPAWSYFDEGPGSRTWVEGVAAEVNLKYPEGSVLPTRFIPMCFSTSCMSLFETPVVFQDVE